MLSVRIGGTEFHLVRLYDFVRSELADGRFVCIASADIGGAYDNLPRSGDFSKDWRGQFFGFLFS